MRAPLLRTLFLICFTALVAGCGAQKGETVFSVGPDDGNVEGKAPRTGEYALYTATSPTPVFKVSLMEGDKLGFHKTTDGRIEAIYEQDHEVQTYKFSKGTLKAYWKVL